MTLSSIDPLFNTPRPRFKVPREARKRFYLLTWKSDRGYHGTTKKKTKFSESTIVFTKPMLRYTKVISLLASWRILYPAIWPLSHQIDQS